MMDLQSVWRPSDLVQNLDLESRRHRFGATNVKADCAPLSPAYGCAR